MILGLAIIALVLSVFPFLMFVRNLSLFCEPLVAEDSSVADRQEQTDMPKVSVLIPARDEESGIERCVSAVLTSQGATLEVVVLDDKSEDETASIVGGLAEADSRVRLVSGAELPSGWNGKQFACKQLADAAKYDYLLFLDADVQLQTDAIAKLVARMQRTEVGLLSAFPAQVTGTWMEKWMIPMIHFILLGYLPFDRMRKLSDPSLAAGCGQLFLTTPSAYRAAGTHAAIAESRHDGVKLPRAYRDNGMMSDVVDGTQLASCRMYEGASAVIQGVLKNATEGIANPRLIGVFTVLLLGCSVLPCVALVFALQSGGFAAIVISAVAMVVSHLPRLIGVFRFRQSILGALCHVPATAGFVILQWVALGYHLTGRKIAWRGRTES